jgi:hypothetical protein
MSQIRTPSTQTLAKPQTRCGLLLAIRRFFADFAKGFNGYRRPPHA